MSIKYKGQSIAGAPGKDATINGQNTLEIMAGDNVTIEQKDSVLTINATGGGSAGGIYSTEETRIGTWINGKPLYRKVIQTNSPPTGWAWISVDIIQNIDIAVDVRCVLMGNGLYEPLSFMDTSGNTNRIIYNKTNSDLQKGILMYIGTKEYVSSPCVITIEYTKTTDVATINVLTYSEADTPVIMSIDDSSGNMVFAPSVTCTPYASVASSVTEKETDV